jgi:hypothetical protein
MWGTPVCVCVTAGISESGRYFWLQRSGTFSASDSLTGRRVWMVLRTYIHMQRTEYPEVELVEQAMTILYDALTIGGASAKRKETCVTVMWRV